MGGLLVSVSWKVPVAGSGEPAEKATEKTGVFDGGTNGPGALTKFEALSTNGAKLGAAGSNERLVNDSTVTGSVTPCPAAGL